LPLPTQNSSPNFYLFILQHSHIHHIFVQQIAIWALLSHAPLPLVLKELLKKGKKKEKKKHRASQPINQTLQLSFARTTQFFLAPLESLIGVI
jgi:hypothetical protein